eukprot:scaffold193640_cov17-Tisochrysis_lutea.AAC.1
MRACTAAGAYAAHVHAAATGTASTRSAEHVDTVAAPRVQYAGARAGSSGSAFGAGSAANLDACAISCQPLRCQ